MTTITIPDALPRLFVGTHRRETGRACMMNAIAYMQGDKEISDMPSCVWQPFGFMVQLINDRICSHQIEVKTGEMICDHEKVAHALCGPCAHHVWMTGVPLIGTGELGRMPSEAQVIQLLRRMAARIVNIHWAAMMNTFPKSYEKIFRRQWDKAREVLDGTRGEIFPPSHESSLLDGLGTHEARMLKNALMMFGGGGSPKTASEMLNEVVLNMLQLGNLNTKEGFRADAFTLSRLLPIFTEWLYEAAGVAKPKQVIVTEAEVELVPVGVR